MNNAQLLAIMRALACHKYGLGSIQSRCRMWVEFVVGSRLALRVFFPGFSIFLPPQKPTLQIPIRPGERSRMKTS